MTDELALFLKHCREDIYPEPDNEGSRQLIQRQWREFLNQCRDLPLPANILDLGCGNGESLRLMRAAGHFPTGLTANPVEFESLIGEGFAISCVDMHEAEFEPGYFHAIWARHILEHSPIPYFMLAKINRALCIGGYLYVEVPCPATDSRHEQNRQHFSVLGWEMWHALFCRSGFRSLSSRSIPICTEGGWNDRYWEFCLQKVTERG